MEGRRFQLSPISVANGHFNTTTFSVKTIKIVIFRFKKLSTLGGNDRFNCTNMLALSGKIFISFVSEFLCFEQQESEYISACINSTNFTQRTFLLFSDLQCVYYIFLFFGPVCSFQDVLQFISGPLKEPEWPILGSLAQSTLTFQPFSFLSVCTSLPKMILVERIYIHYRW